MRKNWDSLKFYYDFEKINIANKYLLPKQIKDNGVKDKEMTLSEGIIKKIVSKMSYLNQIIREDESLGDGFEIGHSYFCTFSSGNEKRWYNNVMEFEIIPLIKEYWFDDPDKVFQYSEELLN